MSEPRADDVLCLKCGGYYHFDYCHTCPPDAVEVPTLHGLNLLQLEATRGYCDTVNVLASAAREADTIKEPCSVFAIQGMMRALKSVRSVGADNDRPYGDGTRFALRLPEVQADIARIERGIAIGRARPTPAQEP